MPDWYDLTEACHEKTLKHDGRLDALSNEWERELAALWRLEADVNNGGYLQFVINWGYESYTYGSQALRKIRATRMAKIIDRCQALLDKHVDVRNASPEQLQALMPNPVIGHDGNIVKEAGSSLPPAVLDQLYELSYRFMDYPDDIEALAKKHYREHLDA